MNVLALRRFGVLALLALPAFFVFAPVLFFGRAFADGDALLQFYPAFSFFRDALMRGDSWVWTPGVMTGFPLAASLVGGFFSPVNGVLIRLLGVFAAYHWLVALSFILTGWFTYALARRLGVGRAGAVLAGLALPWSTAYVSFGSNITVSNGYWLLPLLLWLLVAVRQQPNRWTVIAGILAGGVGTGLTLLTAHTQWPLQALVVALAWAIFLDVRAERHTRITAFAATGTFVAIVALGVLIAWPQLRLTAQFAPLSAREGGLSLQDAFSGGLTPVDLGSYLLPRLNIPYLMAAPEFLYVGALPLLLFIGSFWLPKGGYIRFFRWLFGLAFVASFQYSPVFFVIHWLPGLNLFRVPSRWMYAANLAIAVLAGYALEYLVTDEGRERLRRFARRAVRWVTAFVVAVSAWSIVAFLFASSVQQWLIRYFDAYLYQRTTQLPREHYHDVIARILQTIWQGTTVSSAGVVFGLLTLGAAAALLRWFTAGKLSERRFVALAIALTFLNLVVNPLLGRVATVPARILAEPPQAVRFIREREPRTNPKGEPFRVFGFLTGFTVYDQLDSRFGYEPDENVTLERELLSGNLQLLYGLDGLDDYDNLMDRRSARVLGYLGSNRSTYGENLATQKLTLPEKEARFVARLPVLSAFNVKYVISAYSLHHPDLRAVKQWFAGKYRIGLTLYENLAVRPRYYLAGNVRTISPQREDRSWESFVEAATPAPFVDLIECERCTGASGDGPVAVPVVRASNASYTFVVETATPRWFVFGQAMLPGWRASIDGSPATIYRANYLNQAVYVPAGQHRVEFQFDA